MFTIITLNHLQFNTEFIHYKNIENELFILFIDSDSKLSFSIPFKNISHIIEFNKK